MKTYLNDDGTTEKVYYDDKEDKIHTVKTQDVSSVIEANKRAYNDAGGYESEVFNHKASIPMICIEEWCQQQGIKVQEFFNNSAVLKRFLNDPDNRYFLTRPGKV